MYTHQEHKVQNDENDSTEAGDATHVYLYTSTQSDFCRWKVQFRYSPLAKHSQRTGFTSHWVPLFSRCNGKNSFYFTLSSSHKDNRKRTICIYIVTPDFFHSCGLEFCCNIYADTKECCCFLFLFFIRVSSQPLWIEPAVYHTTRRNATYNVRHRPTWSFTLYLNYIGDHSFVSRRVEIRNNCYVHQLVSGSERATEKEFV